MGSEDIFCLVAGFNIADLVYCLFAQHVILQFCSVYLCSVYSGGKIEDEHLVKGECAVSEALAATHQILLQSPVNRETADDISAVYLNIQAHLQAVTGIAAWL